MIKKLTTTSCGSFLFIDLVELKLLSIFEKMNYKKITLNIWWWSLNTQVA